jgi:hypothetical protein
MESRTVLSAHDKVRHARAIARCRKALLDDDVARINALSVVRLSSINKGKSKVCTLTVIERNNSTVEFVKKKKKTKKKENKYRSSFAYVRCRSLLLCKSKHCADICFMIIATTKATKATTTTATNAIRDRRALRTSPGVVNETNL